MLDHWLAECTCQSPWNNIAAVARHLPELGADSPAGGSKASKGRSDKSTSQLVSVAWMSLVQTERVLT